jgi:hypothetical protein
MAGESLEDLVEAKTQSSRSPALPLGMGGRSRALRVPRRNERREPAPGRPGYALPPGLGDEDLTAITVMRLVADGRVDLDKPVRRYVAELRLNDQWSAAETTLLNLVNHA